MFFEINAWKERQMLFLPLSLASKGSFKDRMTIPIVHILILGICCVSFILLSKGISYQLMKLL